MTWFKVDDGFANHPKVRRIPRGKRAAAVGLWTLAGSWSSRYLTEGVIPGYAIDDLGCTKSQADALVEVDLWHRSGHGCHACPRIDAGSYVFHQWTGEIGRVGNPSREQVEREREASAERQRKARERRRSGATQAEREPDAGPAQGEREASARPARGSRSASARRAQGERDGRALDDEGDAFDDYQGPDQREPANVTPLSRRDGPAVTA